MKLLKEIHIPGMKEWIRHLFLAWLAAALLELILIPEAAAGLEHVLSIPHLSIVRLGIVTLVLTLGLWITSCFYPIDKIEKWSIVGCFLVLMLLALSRNDSDAFAVACMLILGVLVVYAIWGHDSSEKPAPEKEKTHWIFPLGALGIGIVLFAIIAIWTVFRVLCYFTPDYDFGIFSQMFYNMKETGMPLTTTERAELGEISHFKVHVSPIYYLMLPFYCLFPDPITLQVLQAAIISSALIPLYLICKQNGLSGFTSLLLCGALAFLPSTAGSASYDLHENCFLLPLVLWLMYAMDKRNIWLSAIFAVLVLMVKEDAAVYVGVAALYQIVKTAVLFRREKLKDLLLGFGLMIIAVVWFLITTWYLSKYGDGVMVGRYRNLMYGESNSLIHVIFVVLTHPMKVLFECVDAEKLKYIALTLVPLLGLPLLTRKYERYLLLIPYILVNLISDYQYQHDVYFQYNFGSTAFLLYLTAVNLADLRPKLARIIPAAVAGGLCLCLFTYTIVPKTLDMVNLYRNNESYYQGINQSLDIIPDDATVTAHGFYVVPLSERKVLYDLHYCSQEQCFSTEYIVVRNSYESDFKKYGGYEQFDKIVKAKGYEMIHQKGSLVIYRNPAESK